MAKLNAKIAIMDAGKSAALITVDHSYGEQHKLALKPALDTKGDTRITSRTGLGLDTDFLIERGMDLRARILEEHHEVIRRQKLDGSIGQKVVGLSVVLVDEAQFLSPNHITQLYLTALEDDISVIAYALKTDFRARMFPGTQRLLELADTVETIPTMCRNNCGSQARFNARLVDDDYVFGGEQVAIDGSQKVTYKSLCGSCYVAAGGKEALLSDS